MINHEVLKSFAEEQIEVSERNLENIQSFPEAARESLTEYFMKHIRICELALEKLEEGSLDEV